MQRINKAEAAAALLALKSFAAFVRGCDVTLLVDNTPAEGACSRGYSPDPLLAAIVGELWLLAGALDITLWIDRVPTKDNLADPLSRQDFALAEDLLWHWCDPAAIQSEGWIRHWHPGSIDG